MQIIAKDGRFGVRGHNWLLQEVNPDVPGKWEVCEIKTGIVLKQCHARKWLDLKDYPALYSVMCDRQARIYRQPWKSQYEVKFYTFDRIREAISMYEWMLVDPNSWYAHPHYKHPEVRVCIPLPKEG